MKTALQISASLALLAFAALCVVGCCFIVTAQAELSGLQANVLGQVDIEANATRQAVSEQLNALETVADKRLGSIQADMGRQLNATRKDAMGQIAATRADLVTQVALTRADLNNQATVAIASLQRAVSGTVSVSVPLAKVISQVNDGLPYYLDCTAGMCLPNHIYGTAQAIEKMGQSAAVIEAVVAKETPATAAAIRDIAVDASRFTDSVTKPKTTWGKIEGFFESGAKIGIWYFTK